MEPTLAALDKQIAVLQERLRGAELALQNQADEYERRLQELNHAHQQQMERNAEYVSREAWDAQNRAIDIWRREVDKWRWISIGAGIAGGGFAGFIAKIISG
jgi:hypothetical protein